MVDYEVDEDQVKEGAIAGAASFVIGLVAAVVLASPSGGDKIFKVSLMGQSQTVKWSQMGGQGSSKPESWKVAGWVFHKAHFASIDVSLSGLSGMGGSVNISFVMDVPIIVRLAPIILLGAAGFVLAERADVGDIQESAITGAHVVAGYLPLALISVFLLKWEASGSGSGMSGSMTVQPALVTGVLLTGIVVPVVLGAAGGAVNHEYGDDILEAIGQK